MDLTRRRIIQAAGIMPIAAAITTAQSQGAAPAPGTPSRQKPRSRIALPDRGNFAFKGVHLNAAYTHPIGKRANLATQNYISSRMLEPGRNWPVANPRDEAVALFARLINAAPSEVAVVPSTLEGENLIAAALGLGQAAGVVTDPFHYDASLVMYGERHVQGMPLVVLKPRDNRIDYAELEAAITPDIKLVAISLVSSETGHTHDLKTVCEIAHRKGALVYADIIQAAGAVPIDVKASGVDFCCTGMYKWLMGEFGAAFLYVRADRLADLKRVQLGWRGFTRFVRHALPYDAPGPVGGEWTLGTDTASIFEVSTPNWSGLATVAGSLAYIDDIGMDAIVRHRAPMIDRLQRELSKTGFQPLTPQGSEGPTLVFAREGTRETFKDRLARENIHVTLYKNKIRISPSVHNDMADIEKLLGVLTT
jgi:selenocysteine lyase/cysteine desulfurase